MRGPVRPLTAIAYAVAVLLVGCKQESRTGRPATTKLAAVSHQIDEQTSPAGDPAVRFTEVGGKSGLEFCWTIPGTRPLNILQTIGNGCAFLDYDNDGNPDILLVGTEPALFRGDGKGHFTNVTKQVGLDKLNGHFLGCAVGDYDNDGYDDIYISGWQTGKLLHNEEGKRFVDVTQQMGIGTQPWGTSCAFADLDADGFLDLYIANYAKFDPDSDMTLCMFKGVLTSCGPNDYDAIPGVVYHNIIGKAFEDVTRKWGLVGHGKNLGVAVAKYEANANVGIALANDLVPGDLFHLVRTKKYKNVGNESGTSSDGTEEAHAGMGIDWGDYDNDGKVDLFVTTFSKETKCLYHNDGYGVFSLVSSKAKVEDPTLPYVGWGCKFFDADNDGWLDLMIANGHVQDNIRKIENATYREPALFLHNRAGSPVAYADDSRSSGVSRLPPIVGRGLAVGDYDNDGKVDVLIVDSEGKPLLLHNETQNAGNWIGFRLIGSNRSNRNGYGAIVRVVSSGEKRVRQCHPGGSYMSSSDARVHFGLANGKPDIVTIWWPDGVIQSWTDLIPNRYYSVKEGEAPH